MAALARFPVSDPTDQICTALLRDGAVVVEGLLDPDLLARFNAELDPLLMTQTAGDQKFINEGVTWFFGERTRHLTGIAGKSTVFANEILLHPMYMAVCDAVLRPHCSAYQLNLAHVLDRGPGSEQQFVHRDQQVWHHLWDRMHTPRPTVMLASVIALVDFTAENGATRVVPGSHTRDPDRLPDNDELIPAVMPAGSAVIYLGSTLHAGGSNTTTDQWRRGMHVSYCVGWLRTEENQILATPVETVRLLPRAAQKLLGYGAHDAIEEGGGYLGTVALQDPVELLATGDL